MVTRKAKPMPFERSYKDPERICPVWAGPARLVGGQLRVLLPQGDAEIKAAPGLLERMLLACDGSGSLSQIVEGTRPHRLRAKVRAFLLDLLEAGVLIDASLYTASAQRFAWVPSPFGNAVKREIWQQVPRRFVLSTEDSIDGGAGVKTPLDALLEQRHSVHTYDNRPLSETSLRSWLWLLGGIVRNDHERMGKAVPHRTIPSGGAVYALRPILVLRQAVGTLAPGVYTVSFPSARKVELKRVGDSPAWLPRAVSHPWYLSFATGLVFLVADPRLGAIKYRARAFQYLFIEAGAALQNAALAAPGLDIAMSVYGGYVESVAAANLQISPDEVIVSSAVFGPTPTPQQLQADRTAPHLEFEWADSPSGRYTMPFYLGRCNVELRGELLHESWGRASDPWLAYIKSAVESVERLGFRSPRDIQYGCVQDWESALDPTQVVRYSPVQYKDKTFQLKPFRQQTRCGWVKGRSLLTGREVMVLAEQVYAAGALKELFPAALARYTESNSSGCAAHLDAERAQEAALLELVERDAFMRSWLSQSPGIELRLRTLPGELQKRVTGLIKMGCRTSIQLLPSQWGAVAAAYAQHDGLHFTVVGASARRTLVEALEGALDELETLAYVRFHDQEVPPLVPSTVKSPTDHTSIYAVKRYYRRADPVMATTDFDSFARRAKLTDAKDSIAHRLISAGREVVVVDIAAPHSSIDQGRTPVFVVRTLVPGLVPISFGFNREPLGMAEAFDRRSRFPHPFP